MLSAGNFYLLKPDYDKAIDAYRELQQRFPNAGRASYAHWKVAWLSLRQGRTAEAKAGFEQQIGLYPTSAEVPAALYWRARLAEEDKDTGMARAYYQKLSERFRNFYYGELARQRLREIKPDDDPARDLPHDLPHYALLDRVPAINAGTNFAAADPPTDNLRYQKAQVLKNGGLLDFAVQELQAAATEEQEATRATGCLPKPRNSTKMPDAMTERSRYSNAPCPTISPWICPPCRAPTGRPCFPSRTGLT